MFVTDEEAKKEYDVAIIGGGPAGITTAMRLAEQTSAKIALIESGGVDYDAQISQLAQNNATGDLSSGYYMVHSQPVLGGASQVWSGHCNVLEQRSFMTGEWPISYEDIEPYYKPASEILEMREESYTTPSKSIPNSQFLVYRPLFLSPPVRFGTKYRDYLEQHKTIDVFLNTTCKKIESNDTEATSLILQNSTTPNATSNTLKARHYVVACGGIGVPRLLQLSGIASESPVGNYFMEHPHYFELTDLEVSRELMGHLIFEEQTLNRVMSGVARRIGVNSVRRNNVIHAFQFSDEFCVKNNLLNFSVVFDVRNIEKRNLFGASREAYVCKAEIRAEMPPLKINRISLDAEPNYLQQPKANINFDFNYQKILEKNWQLFSEELLRSGLGRTALLPDNPDVTGGGHFMGTTRMGKTTDDSVVDENCKVHGVNNLYVAGSSLFPAGGAANPTFSIVAFSLRLGDYLSKLIGKNS